MGDRERELFLSMAKSAHRGGSRNRSCLAGVRLVLRIFAWFEPHGRLRDGAQVADEIAMDHRVMDWAVSLSGISGSLQPEQDMANYFLSNSGRAGFRDHRTPPMLLRIRSRRII